MTTTKIWQKNKHAQIGIMGGAFNPFHNGHLRHAIEVLERMPLDHIELLPSAHHPHKKGLLPFQLRVDCIEHAIKDIPFLSINTIENEISAPSYTEKVLQAWRKQHPLHKPYFLLGTEDFSALHTWNKGREIPTLAHLLIVSRHGSDAELVCNYAQKLWGDIYISYENTYKYNTLTIQDDSFFDSKNNEESQYLAEKNAKHMASIIKECYHIFSEKSNISKAEQLQIAIPNIGFCTYLHIPHIDISATQIRELWSEKKCLAGLMPPQEQDFLSNNHAILEQYWSK